MSILYSTKFVHWIKVIIIRDYFQISCLAPAKRDILTSVKVKEYPSGLTTGMMYQSYLSTSLSASESPPRANCIIITHHDTSAVITSVFSAGRYCIMRSSESLQILSDSFAVLWLFKLGFASFFRFLNLTILKIQKSASFFLKQTSCSNLLNDLLLYRVVFLCIQALNNF